MAAAHPRRIVASVVAGLLLLGFAACSRVNPQATPTPSTSPSSTPAATASAPPTTAPPTTAPAFPTTAPIYAEAVLLAWRTNNLPRLAQLVSPGVLSQLQAAKNVEPNWANPFCDGSTDSVFCVYYNGDGDVITLRVLDQLIGKPNAVIDVKLDRTTYSNNAIEYVKTFIEAWRQGNTKRLAALANPAEVEYFTHFTPPGPYSTCAVLSSPVANVRVYNAEGLNYTFTVSLLALGGKHAITGHAAAPAACT
jgi:hypothetical protein